MVGGFFVAVFFFVPIFCLILFPIFLFFLQFFVVDCDVGIFQI